MLPHASVGFKSSVKFAVFGKEPEARAPQQKELTLYNLFKRERRKQPRRWEMALCNRKSALERTVEKARRLWLRGSLERESIRNPREAASDCLLPRAEPPERS